MATPIVHWGDCLDVMRDMPENSVDSIVTDPPYGLSKTTSKDVVDALTEWLTGDRAWTPKRKGFMGKTWDAFVPPPAVWDECFRVLKPGGHVVAFAGPRTHDLMGMSIRLAGFEIRDSLAWLYGSGFPKSLDVSKAIDKAAGAERDIIGKDPQAARRSVNRFVGTMNGGKVSQDNRAEVPLTVPATDEAKQWQGWGTALKPAFEPIVLARKPLTGTVAANTLLHGVGGLNIDATRIDATRIGASELLVRPAISRDDNDILGSGLGVGVQVEPAGRWPANVVLDESQAEALDRQSGHQKDGTTVSRNRDPDAYKGNVIYGKARNGSREDQTYGSGGGASRFFYQAKAGKAERPVVDGVAHPTVKPLAIMQWLIKLVTPPGGTTLDPFAGSGTTVEAAVADGFRCIAIEREAEYLPLIDERLRRVQLAHGESGGGLQDALAF